MHCVGTERDERLQRLVNVTPEIGYGDKGIGEIPPNATVQLSIELLNVKK